MNMERREVLKAGSGLGLLGLLVAAGLITPGEARAEWAKAAFDAKSIEDTLKALGAGKPDSSADIQITAPDIAENGAVVPVGVVTALPDVQVIALLVEKNPNPLAASFTLPAGTEPSVQTRVKMGQTSDVYAVVKAGGKFLMTKKEIKVTLGGCGG
ncbi:MAG TPA: thiosulfate oxidation carrier protein SoxY [Zoogloea sp.]|uniref:thiosulfate oxidation carrier protein SoxY n=1 Tax=Zoogloea sp. TaxID=49181 RepID=UPI002D181CBD|nr:thiosulfate oxidation carrier protein SoxY [Zoogloea sp.]HMV17730.1 thiosulfate oxidation carrier protein SoxY [Rhodocyclaceae bacterium]HMV62189.1 thiosulfate oxidation carrier protein SoxY [Rhodocyclaceae bacterium]HMW51841.1 thiosulfate oxidation carrier protein SoxY [Rhodocyclaceae bacterium]HMY49974.1 thiosulfate oxidation carrier protein SoxY [Rhodocyclaceae bacterium]HMZ77729.1 thiosulfate oxidation carrier protein SoxY [Rhodocyclaceae bacterium]